jgi:hypothetical protein
VPLEREDIDRLVRQMEELTMEAHVLWQAVDEARTDIVHEVRRLMDTPVMARESSEALAQSVTCFQCDNSADSLAEAVKEGWNDLQEDPKGFTWNYLGTCASCRTDEAAETVPSVKAREPRSQGELF